MQEQKSNNAVTITWIIVGAVIVLTAVALILFLSLRPGITVNANGIAQVKATPDLVSVYLNVETNGSDAKEAKDKNAEIVDKVITELLKKGIDRSNITTEQFNIYPDYDWSTGGNGRIIGYKATHSIRIQLLANNMEKAGDVIDAGVDSGALVSYINFELSQAKQNEYKAQALKEATQDARIKAENIATGLGKKLGAVVSVQDSNFDYYPWPVYRNDAMVVSGSSGYADAKSAIETNINPGQQDISAQVSVVFKLI
jgi:uncharacterized protein